MKVYVAYYYFLWWKSENGKYRECEYCQLMGIFSTYKKAFNAFRDKYKDYIECGNNKSYEDYVNEYGTIKELTLDELLNRDEVTIY